MDELTPPVKSLADLVVRIAGEVWPETAAERDVMFRRLGLRLVAEGQSTPSQDPRMTFQPVETSLSGLTCSATAIDGQFLGLSLFAYTEHQDAGPQAGRAAPELKRLITGEIGCPVEEWGPSNEPACYWSTGRLGIEMYCFQRRPSGAMIAIYHAGRSAAYEASL